MIYYTFTIENEDKSFLITEGKTKSNNELTTFNVYNYKDTLMKGDLLIHYTTQKGKDVYKLVRNGIHLFGLTDSYGIFNFYLFTTSNIFTISVNQEFLDNVELKVLNQTLDKTTTLFILPELTAIPCSIRFKNNKLPIFELIFAYPILLKRFTTTWSIS